MAERCRVFMFASPSIWARRALRAWSPFIPLGVAQLLGFGIEHLIERFLHGLTDQAIQRPATFISSILVI
jgi:hypothetical protein